MRARGVPLLRLLLCVLLACRAAADEAQDKAAAQLLLDGFKALQQQAARLTAPPAPGGFTDTSVTEILKMGSAGAQRARLPVRVRGVVTCVEEVQGWFFVQDDTGGLFVWPVPGVAAPLFGEHVTVEGRTVGGEVAAYVSASRVIRERQAPLPAPLSATCAEVRSVQKYGRWTELDGWVRDVAVMNEDLLLLVITRATPYCRVRIAGAGHRGAGEFLEARVRFRGVQWYIRSAQLQVADREDCFTVVERGPLSVFDRPAVTGASQLALPLQDTGSAKLQGTVRFTDCLGRLWLDTDDGVPAMLVPYTPGTGSPVPAWTGAADGTAVEAAATYHVVNGVLHGHVPCIRPGGTPTSAPPPLLTTPPGAQAHVSKLLTVSGRPAGVTSRSMARYTPAQQTISVPFLTLEDDGGGGTLQVCVPPEMESTIKALDATRLVEITGLLVPGDIAGTGPAKTPALWLRSPGNLKVAGLTREAFHARLWWGAGGLGALFVAGAGFLWALREKLKRQRSEAAIVSAHNATLEARVAERTAALAAANERLALASEEAVANLARERELGELKSNFVSMVSHEFRTPLAVILSSTDILSNHLDRLSTGRRAQQLAGIRSSTQQMARLIEEVLLLGKVEAGKLAFAPVPLDLRAFCSELVDEALSATTRRCPIALELADDIPAQIHADPALLRHIFSNLLSNAVKYSPEGAPVKLSVAAADGDIIFKVEDKGIGIPAEDQPRLFEAFHRAGNAGTISGTGLGLMITKRCVELHGGGITLQSAPGEGTVVTVHLPNLNS